MEKHQDVDEEAAGWEPYYRGKSRLWAGFILFLPIALLVGIVVQAAHLPDGAMLAILGILSLVWVLGVRPLASFQCPLCTKPFFAFGRFGTANLRSRKCVHCGGRAPERA